MKKLSLLVIALLVAAACQDKGPERYTNSGPEIDVLKALIKDYNEGNWTSWASHYADTVKIYHNSLEAAKAADVVENLKGLLAATSSYGFVDKDMFHERIIDDDNETWVNFWATWKGTLKESGEKLVIPVHLTSQFIDGKIVEEHAYYDLSKFVAALQKIEAAAMETSEEGE